jgi:hypothetical protein
MEAAMSMNEDRADWAEIAATVFAEIVSCGDISEETVTDLVCDLGHFAKLRLGFSKDEIIRLFEIGVGAWLAEDDHPEGEPFGNYYVTLVIDDELPIDNPPSTH